MTPAAPAAQTVTPDELVARAAALRDDLVAAQAETEERTHYSPQLHRSFEAAGFYRMYVPRRYGGLEVDVPTFLRVGIELGRGDISAAWGLSLAANHALQVASWFPQQLQDEVFGPGDFRCASVAAPTVRATADPDGGGYRLDGAVAYCSGVPWSTWYMGQAALPGTDAAGLPRMGLFVAPRDAFTMLDDWGHTLGLKGTGSNSIRFDDARIPAHALLEDVNMIDVDVAGGTPGLALHGNPMYGGRALCIFTMSLAGAIVGGGYNALDEYANQMRSKPAPVAPFIPRTEDPDYQRWYGAALVKVQTAEAALLFAAQQHMEACRRNATGEQPYTFADDARLAAIARETIVQVWEAVEQNLYRTIGSSAARNGERFERVFRDLAMTAGHRNTMLRESFFRQIGALDLGVPLAGTSR
jgi:3-hydroxy-9,10-secoandrosta-1,3,5(10)-triene-9,17-dione monooxygenase